MNKHKLFTLLLYFILIPALILLGILLWQNRHYNIVSMGIALLSCFPLFVRFEKQKMDVKELVTLSVMIGLSVVGRIIFVLTPGFKPVTAIIILTAIAFGSQAGFITGSISAVVSNIYFGQGPWTPFQMFSWGFIGFISGLIFKKNEEPNIVLLIIVGFFGGIIFSLLMDIYSTISLDQGFNFTRYLAFVVSALPFTLIYAASNIIFLLVLQKTILEKLNRMKKKYGIF